MATKWRSREIEFEKKKLRSELEARFGAGSSESEVAEYLLVQIFESTLGSSTYGIWHFVRVMKVLILHKSAKCLSDSQISKLSKLAVQILQQAKVSSTDSTLAYLYGEVEIVLSQIAKNEGRHWFALWKSAVADSMIGDSNPEGLGFRLLTIAHRELRVGDALSAINSFREAETRFEKLTREWWSARLGTVKALRMSGDTISALSLGASTQEVDDQSMLGSSLELKWEQTIAGALLDGNFESVFSLLQSEIFENQTTYLVEAFFWRSLKSPGKDRRGVPKMSFLLRKDNKSCRELGHFFEVALALERLEDRETPRYVKLAALSDVLEQSRQLVSIDKELLTLACMSRWLAEHDESRMSKLIASEYRSICLKLSDGKDGDLLRLNARPISVQIAG
jgi:hypothetical protein